MKRIEAEVMTRFAICNDDSYSITVHDVMNAVTHLKQVKLMSQKDYLVNILFMIIENYMYYCQLYLHYF